jgi:hypothetical protein
MQQVLVFSRTAAPCPPRRPPRWLGAPEFSRSGTAEWRRSWSCRYLPFADVGQKFLFSGGERSEYERGRLSLPGHVAEREVRDV